MDAITLLEGRPRQGQEAPRGTRVDDRARGQDPQRAVRDDQGRADGPRDHRGGDLLPGAQGAPEGAGHRPRGLRGAPRRRPADGRARGARRHRRDVGRQGQGHEGEHRAPHRGRGGRDVRQARQVFDKAELDDLGARMEARKPSAGRELGIPFAGPELSGRWQGRTGRLTQQGASHDRAPHSKGRSIGRMASRRAFRPKAAACISRIRPPNARVMRCSSSSRTSSAKSTRVAAAIAPDGVTDWVALYDTPGGPWIADPARVMELEVVANQPVPERPPWPRRRRTDRSLGAPDPAVDEHP